MGDDSLRRLANGVLLASFRGTRLPEWVPRLLADDLAGVVLFGPNVVDAEQVRALAGSLYAAAEQGVVVAVDEEGGDVTRMAYRTGSPYPGNLALGAVDDVDLTRRVYAAMGAELAGAGMTLDLAPSVDVLTADSVVIGPRSFGADAELVGRHARAAVDGLHEAGVAACAKHFPGHGSAREDSHLELPTLAAGPTELRARDLVPFRAVAETVDAVMTAHVRVPGLCDGPATLSPEALALAREAGFTGPLVSDALDMRGVSGEIGLAEAAVRALTAGVDLLCIGSELTEPDVLAVRDAVVDSVRAGRLPSERLAEAAARAATLRRHEPAGTPATADVELGLDAARQALRVDGNVPAIHGPVVVELAGRTTLAEGVVPWGLATLRPRVDVRRLTPADVPPADLPGGGPLVVSVRNAHRYADLRDAVERLTAARDDVVVVELGVPEWRPPRAAAHLATYGASPACALAAAERLGL